jgi:hypothetical protein
LGIFCIVTLKTSVSYLYYFILSAIISGLPTDKLVFMFNPFKSEGSAAGRDNNFVVSDELRIAIDEAGLSGDPAIAEMIKTGFVSPNGVEHDPVEFIAQRKALVESGENGAEAPRVRVDQLVTPAGGEGSERKLTDIDA